jgi:ParB/RepB/Spo0J family partition protein
MEVVRIPLKQIQTDSEQPRKTFEDVGELASSILKEGLLEPLKVMRLTPRRFILIDGERRFRALEMYDPFPLPAVSATSIATKPPALPLDQLKPLAAVSECIDLN